MGHDEEHAGEHGEHDEEYVPTREERLAELAERREARRREQRSSKLVGLLFVALLGAGTYWVLGPVDLSKWRIGGGAEVDGTLPERIAELVERGRREGPEAVRDEAEALRREAESAGDRASADAALAGWDALEERWASVRSKMSEAQARTKEGRLGEAIELLDRLHLESAELPTMRDQAYAMLQGLRANVRERGGVATVQALDATSQAQVEALLDEGDYVRARAALAALRSDDEDAEYELAVLQRRLREECEAGARAHLARVDQFVSRGNILIAVQMLYREEIEQFRDSDLWLPLLRRAEEIEDLIDSKGGRRPFPRRRHLPRELREDADGR